MSSAALIARISALLFNCYMKTVEEIRRLRLAALVSEVGTVVRVANTIKRGSAQVSQWLNASPDSRTGKPRTISNASARLIERAFDKPVGWLDHFSEFPPAPEQAAVVRIESGFQPYNTWPFRRLDARRFFSLPQSEQDVIEGMIIGAVQSAEARIGAPRASGQI